LLRTAQIALICASERVIWLCIDHHTTVSKICDNTPLAALIRAWASRSAGLRRS